MKINFILIMFILIFTMSSANAGTYFVNINVSGGNGSFGNPWNITEGFTNAVAGDTVLIQGGNYDDTHPVVGNSGNSTHRITFQTDNGTAVLDGNDQTGNGIYSASKNYITLDGIELKNYDKGVYLYDSDYMNVVNCTAYDNNKGFGYYDSNYNTISNSTAYSNDDYGIIIQLLNNFTISNNTIYSNLKNGMYLHTASDNEITSNIIHSNSQKNIYVYSNSINNIFNENDVYYPLLDDYVFNLNSSSNIVSNSLNITNTIDTLDNGSSIIIKNTDGQIFNETSSKTTYGHINGTFSLYMDNLIESVVINQKNYKMGFNTNNTEIIGNVPLYGETENITINSGEVDWWKILSGLESIYYTTLFTNDTHIETQMAANGIANFTTNLSSGVYRVSSLQVDIVITYDNRDNESYNRIYEISNITAGINYINISYSNTESRKKYHWNYWNDTEISSQTTTLDNETLWFNHTVAEIQEGTYYISETIPIETFVVAAGAFAAVVFAGAAVVNRRVRRGIRGIRGFWNRRIRRR